MSSIFRSFRPRKLISLFISMIMVATMVPSFGAVAFAEEKDHDCNGHEHADALPTGGTFEPEIIFEEAPPVEELLLPEGKDAEDSGKSVLRSTPKKSLKSGAKSGYATVAEELANTIFDTPDAAVDTVRRAMAEGTDDPNGLRLVLNVDMSYFNDYDLSQSTDWNNFMNGMEWLYYDQEGKNVWGKAMAYTGDPREGDYLAFRWNTGSYGMGIPQPGNYAPDGSGRPYMQWNATIGFFTTKSQEEEVDELVDEVLEELDLEGKSELQKIKDIYGWVTTEVTYDFTNLNVNGHTLKYTAYAAIKNGTAVCQGYAALLYRMMNEAGIECRMVHGIGAGGNHAWNAAKAGTRWYFLDSTWDYQLKDDDGGYDEDQWEYFLRGRNDFGDHHDQVGSNVGHNLWPDGVDYQYGRDVWFQKYPVPANRYYEGSNDPDCTHSWNSGVVVQELGCEQDEKRKYTCTRCNATRVDISEEHPISGHFAMSETIRDVEATCTRPSGSTMQCYKCGQTYFRADYNGTPALGHNYGTCQPLPSSDPDYMKKHKRVCSRDGNHVEKAAHKWDNGVVSVDPTETQEGVRTFTCGDCGLTRTETIDPIAHTHSWGQPVYTWNSDNSKVTAKRVCTKNGSHQETETVDTTSSITTQPSCTTAGERTYESAAFTNSAFAKQTKTVSVAATGHSFGAASYTWNSDNSKVTAIRVCTKNGSHHETETVNASSSITTQPSCTTAGERKYESAAFANNAFAKQTKTETIATTGHSYGNWQPLPTGDPEYLSKHQRACRDGDHVEKADHTWNSGTVTKPANNTEEGVRTFTCTGCGAVKEQTFYQVVVVENTENKTKPTSKVLGAYENKKNPLTVKAKTVTIKAKNLKKKNQIIKRAKAMTVKNSKGTLTYTKVKVNKKKYAGRFSVNKKTGNITVKKKTKKGTYKITIKVRAAGNKYYKAGSRNVTVTIKVK